MLGDRSATESRRGYCSFHQRREKEAVEWTEEEESRKKRDGGKKAVNGRGKSDEGGGWG